VAATADAPSAAGALLREWRLRRRLSQLDVAMRSAVSARHLSFIENGRSRPSREMVLHLAQRLDVPLRERNRLLLAAGYAPGFSEHSLDERELAPVREALDRLLCAHEPYPALVVDRRWNIVAANRGVDFVVRGVKPELLAPPANALRVALHPEGLAPRIVNLGEWSAQLLERVRRELDVAPDAELDALYEELAAYPGVSRDRDIAVAAGGIMLMHTLELDDSKMTLFSQSRRSALLGTSRWRSWRSSCSSLLTATPPRSWRTASPSSRPPPADHFGSRREQAATATLAAASWAEADLERVRDAVVECAEEMTRPSARGELRRPRRGDEVRGGEDREDEPASSGQRPRPCCK
jgi:transcriptional regulator with XRE-family HTH domain